MVRHAGLVSPGQRVLDIACGTGRHSLFFADRGLRVVGLDRDRDKLATLRAASPGQSVLAVVLDLETAQLPESCADLTLVVRYLDRRRFPDFLRTVRAGGYFLAETFTIRQRELGWGPRSADHLLQRGELPSLVAPFQVLAAQEMLLDQGRRAHVAGVVARRPAGE